MPWVDIDETFASPGELARRFRQLSHTSGDAPLALRHIRDLSWDAFERLAPVLRDDMGIHLHVLLRAGADPRMLRERVLTGDHPPEAAAAHWSTTTLCLSRGELHPLDSGVRPALNLGIRPDEPTPAAEEAIEHLRAILVDAPREVVRRLVLEPAEALVDRDRGLDVRQRRFDHPAGIVTQLSVFSEPVDLFGRWHRRVLEATPRQVQLWLPVRLDEVREVAGHPALADRRFSIDPRCGVDRSPTFTWDDLVAVFDRVSFSEIGEMWAQEGGDPFSVTRFAFRADVSRSRRRGLAVFLRVDSEDRAAIEAEGLRLGLRLGATWPQGFPWEDPRPATPSSAAKKRKRENIEAGVRSAVRERIGITDDEFDLGKMQIRELSSLLFRGTAVDIETTLPGILAAFEEARPALVAEATARRALLEALAAALGLPSAEPHALSERLFPKMRGMAEEFRRNTRRVPSPDPVERERAAILARVRRIEDVPAAVDAILASLGSRPDGLPP